MTIRASIVARPHIDAPPDRRRRAWAWAAIGAFTILVGLAGALLSGVGEWTARDRLDPESVGPDGTAALVALLRDGGVDVTVTRDRAETLRLLGAMPATLVVTDSPLLGDAALRDIFDAASDAVLIDPRTRAVEMLFPGATAGGVAPAEAVAPDCDADAAVRAGAIVPGRLLLGASPGTIGCYPARDGFGMLVRDDGDSRVAVFDGRELITNATLPADGNAALALNLMGRLPNLIWYVPSIDDSDVTTAPTLGDLTPSWVTPAIVLLVVSALTAGLWRGRRFGPLVIERLPVTARAEETMQGRARLYERGRDALHAADALRLGTLERLRTMLGLPPAASAAEIADAAGERAGLPHESARRVLIEDEPRTERALLAISDELRALEDAVGRHIRRHHKDTDERGGTHER